MQFLEQLFAALRRAGILKSQRGVKGGYSFAREPSQVTVLEVDTARKRIALSMRKSPAARGGQGR